MFPSFFLAGFEGSTGYNRHGEWFDQVAATGHDQTVEQDYQDIAAIGLHAARESIRWPLVDRGRGRYDFATVEPFVAAAQGAGVDVIWDLFHYGYPRDLDPLSGAFTERFGDYCFAVGRYIAARTDGAAWFTPVNEPSFFSFAGGDQALFAPHLRDRGWELKVALCRAAIRGIEALWAACPGARMVNADPLCRVAVGPDRPSDAEPVRHFNETVVFESWDMISGRRLPELGGSRAHLDIVGINYYWTNQWEFGRAALPDGRIPPLADDDPRRVPLPDLIRRVYERYGGELMVTETAHVGDQRGPWLLEVARASESLIGEGVPLLGVCLYPILGMPEWHAPDVWTPMGLWDPVCDREPHGGRLICEPMATALQSVRHLDGLSRTAMAEMGNVTRLSGRKKRPPEMPPMRAGHPAAVDTDLAYSARRPRTRLR
jgi:hypothetical protein